MLASDAGDPLALLIAKRYPDPETGELLAAPARAVAIEDSLAGREVGLMDGLGFGREIAVVADEDTQAALGRRVMRALSSRFDVIAPEHPGFGESDTPDWLDTINDLAYFDLDLLAALGLAVSKINHDLRNLLTSAQLFSERLAKISDPHVQPGQVQPASAPGSPVPPLSHREVLGPVRR